MPDRINRVGQQVGNYRLLRYLGGGGFGYVYLGEALGSGEQVAIKVLHERLTGSSEFKEFINEARTFRLKHPHITPLLDFGVTSDDVPYLVMEYAPGGTLRNRHPKGTTLALDQVVSYVIPLASALSYAHEQHLVHRDVKPENMLVAADGRLLLSDFGIATVAQSSHLLDLQESVVGTMPYVAPEQLQGKPRPASDQYSLAVVTYEWLTGVRPFNGTQAELFMQHTTTPPPPLREHVPTLPIEVEQVVLTALAKTPGARFATVRAFAHALAQAADVTAPPAPFAIKDAASERFSLFEQPGPAATTPIMSEPLQQASTPPLTGPTQATPLAAAQPSPTHRAPAPALSRRALIAGLIGLSLVGGSAGVIYLTRSATGKAAFSKDTSTATSTAASTATTTHATPSPHATATQAASPSPTATQNNQQLLAQSTIYIGSTDNTLYALNTLDGGVRWNYQGGDWMNSRPAVANNVVYAGCSDHYLYALGALHGDLLWSYRAGDKIVSWPMLANNMLYFGSWDSYRLCITNQQWKAPVALPHRQLRYRPDPGRRRRRPYRLIRWIRLCNKS